MDKATKCENMLPLSRYSTPIIEARLAILEAWPLSRAAAGSDPRCGCAEDGTGVKCDWDDTESLTIELWEREVLANG